MKKIFLLLFLVFTLVSVENSNRKILTVGSSNASDTHIQKVVLGGVNNYDNYAEAYFSNLNDNYAINSYNSCGFVALEMLLNYYDNSFNGNIVDSKYEAAVTASVSDNSTPTFKNSPGSKYDDNDYANLSEYINEIKNTSEQYLHSKLLNYAINRGIYNKDGFGSTSYDIESVCMDYLNSIGFKNKYKITAAYHNVPAGRSDACKEYMDYVIEKVKKGHPVIICMSVLDGHAGVAFKYDEEKDLLYFHYGKREIGVAMLNVSEYKDSFIFGYVDLDISECDTLNYNYIVNKNGNITYYPYFEESINVIHKHDYTYKYENINTKNHLCYCRCGLKKCSSHLYTNTSLVKNIYYDECECCGALRKHEDDNISLY